MFCSQEVLDMEKVPGAGGGAGGMRSYSDFMRSLAAKYNNNEYLRGGSSPPPPPTAVKPDPPGSPLFPFLLPSGLSPLQLHAAAAGLSGLSPFLQQQLETPSPPSQKRVRATDDPLDLTEKRIKVENRSRGSVSPPPPDHSTSPPSSPSCPSPPVASVSSILEWSVDQVASFVGQIEMCKEYEQVFLDNKLDGGCLPLLTESHLTSGLGMKLGPALKLLTALRHALGPSFGAPKGGCVHCAHCHQQERPGSVKDD